MSRIIALPAARPRRAVASAPRLAALALIGLAALAALVAGPAPRTPEGLAAPESARVLEDWRGNGAGFAPAVR